MWSAAPALWLVEMGELTDKQTALVKEKEIAGCVEVGHIGGSESLKMGFEDARSREVASERLEKINNVIVECMKVELEEKDEKIKEPQAKIDAREKKAKPKKRKRKRQH